MRFLDIERGIYKSQREVLHAALRLLSEHHMKLEAEWLNFSFSVVGSGGVGAF